MGYYINIDESTFTIPKANLAEAYERMCALNDRDDLKRGGAWPLSAAANAMDAAARKALGYHPDKWFSWMAPDYPTKCADAASILEMVGFQVETTTDGDLRILFYDRKAGQEDLFLTVISDLATGSITWRGEEGEMWRETYGEEAVAVQNGEVVFGKSHPRTIDKATTFGFI